MQRPPWQNYGFSGGPMGAPPTTASTIAPPLGSRSGGPQGNLQFPMKGAMPAFSTQNIPKPQARPGI